MDQHSTMRFFRRLRNGSYYDRPGQPRPAPASRAAPEPAEPRLFEQIHVRQVPRPGKMAAAGTIARVLAGELGAGPRIEDMRPTVELIPQSLPVDQPDRP